MCLLAIVMLYLVLQDKTMGLILDFSMTSFIAITVVIGVVVIDILGVIFDFVCDHCRIIIIDILVVSIPVSCIVSIVV